VSAAKIIHVGTGDYKPKSSLSELGVCSGRLKDSKSGQYPVLAATVSSRTFFLFYVRATVTVRRRRGGSHLEKVRLYSLAWKGSSGCLCTNDGALHGSFKMLQHFDACLAPCHEDHQGLCIASFHLLLVSTACMDDPSLPGLISYQCSPSAWYCSASRGVVVAFEAERHEGESMMAVGSSPRLVKVND
jgi:hypothetical protein